MSTRSLGLTFASSLALALTAGGLASDARADDSADANLASPWTRSRQLVVVVTPSWKSATGSLERYERASLGEAFVRVGARVKVVVGRRGLRPVRDSAFKKREGDLRSPSGIFPLRSLFGSGTRRRAWKLPYERMTKHHGCVDDPSSPEYNRIVDARSFPSPPPWKSWERMRRRDGQYQLGVVVGHNEARAADEGSCIFLHVWNRKRPTSGCTAMRAVDLRRIAAWLDTAAKPLLVQLPRVAWRALGKRILIGR